jgi:hypothetical protein
MFYVKHFHLIDSGYHGTGKNLDGWRRAHLTIRFAFGTLMPHKKKTRRLMPTQHLANILEGWKTWIGALILTTVSHQLALIKYDHVNI